MKTVYVPYVRCSTSGHYLSDSAVTYGNETFLYFGNNLRIMGIDKLLQKEKYK